MYLLWNLSKSGILSSFVKPDATALTISFSKEKLAIAMYVHFVQVCELNAKASFLNCRRQFEIILYWQTKYNVVTVLRPDLTQTVTHFEARLKQRLSHFVIFIHSSVFFFSMWQGFTLCHSSPSSWRDDIFIILTAYSVINCSLSPGLQLDPR